jgi:PIN domain nuclease of toxin-antitoxin system
VKLLLDTHVWLGALLEPERLSPAVRTALTSPVEWVDQMVRALPRREAALSHDIAIASRGLTLVTADARLLGSTEFAVMAN